MKRIIPILSATLLCLSISNASKAQIFVKIIDNTGTLINGESIDAKHANEINATTFGQENTGCAATPVGGGGGSTCGGTAGHFIFNMNINASVPALNKAVFFGTHLRSADIVFRKTNGTEYYKIHLESVIISHVTNSADPATGLITVQVELAADKMGWTYIPQDPTGAPGTPVKFGWDTTTRSAWSF